MSNGIKFTWVCHDSGRELGISCWRDDPDVFMQMALSVTSVYMSKVLLWALCNLLMSMVSTKRYKYYYIETFQISVSYAEMTEVVETNVLRLSANYLRDGLEICSCITWCPASACNSCQVPFGHANWLMSSWALTSYELVSIKTLQSMCMCYTIQD